MRREKMKKITAMGLLTAMAITSLAGCAKSEGGSSSNSGVTKVVIGARQDYNGISYLDDDGNLTGWDVEMMKLIDEKLPEYEFEYDVVGQEAILMGLDTKQYAAGLGGYFYNEDRAAKYMFPEGYISGALACMMVREGEEDTINSLEALYDAGGKLIPISPISGTYGIVDTYNKTHPDKAIELGTIEWNSVGMAEYATWLREGVYDANLTLKQGWDLAVEQGVDLSGTAISEPFSFVPGYTIFAQGQEEFMAAYDRALAEIIESGEAAEIAKKWVGIDMYSLDSDE